MRSLIVVIAVALGLFAIMTLVETTAEPAKTPPRATAVLPDADPVIVNLDTTPPLAANRRDGLAGPPTRRFTDI